MESIWPIFFRGSPRLGTGTKNLNGLVDYWDVHGT